MMKIFHKKVDLGDGTYKFGVSVDRAMVADVFDKYPDVMKALVGANKADFDENAEDYIIKMIETNQFKTMLCLDEIAENIVKDAFPLMLKKADIFDGTDNAEHWEELWTYLDDNDALDAFVTGMFDFITSVFTQDTTETKPKIKVVIK